MVKTRHDGRRGPGDAADRGAGAALLGFSLPPPPEELGGQFSLVTPCVPHVSVLYTYKSVSITLAATSHLLRMPSSRRPPERNVETSSPR